jgi:DNA-binding NarL/FixJ family response regulator
MTMKYLIVDDNESFRKLIRDEISKNGDVVFELDDGLNVNSVYKEFKPDWVLMDIKMKIVDGLKATDILKREFPRAHVAIVSDYSDERFRDEAKKVGA